MLLEMASVEDEALSEASPGTGDPWLGRRGLRQHDREGNVQGFWNIYMGTTSSGPLVSCSGFSWATRQWGPESWEIQECLLSTVGGESPQSVLRGGA